VRRWRALLLLVLALAGAACTTVKRPEETEGLLLELESTDPSARAWAVAELARRGEMRALPGLVRRLRDEDGGIRLMSAAALRDLTGEEHGFRAFGPIGEREAAVRRWEAWLTGAEAP
jgi:HEAT repeat protein